MGHDQVQQGEGGAREKRKIFFPPHDEYLRRWMAGSQVEQVRRRFLGADQLLGGNFRGVVVDQLLRGNFRGVVDFSSRSLQPSRPQSVTPLGHCDAGHNDLWMYSESFTDAVGGIVESSVHGKK